jgi:basic amino acid/polyamine antiporter, APA family
VLRHTDPQRERPFKVPFIWPVSLAGAAACLYVMVGLPTQAWVRFAWWLALGLLLYFAYGHQRSHLRRTV